jgi:hypothetical protein
MMVTDVRKRMMKHANKTTAANDVLPAFVLMQSTKFSIKGNNC